MNWFLFLTGLFVGAPLGYLIAALMFINAGEPNAEDGEDEPWGPRQ